MNDFKVYTFISEARNCALVMSQKAAYIRGELANVQMNDVLRAETEQVCSALISTKFDIISELSELDEILDSNASTAVITSRMNRILQWLNDDITKMHQLVMALESASKQDPACVSAYILVAESAKEIRDAFYRARAAVTPLHS